MRKQPSRQLINLFETIAEIYNAPFFTVSMPIICDNCQDDDKEAFPYCVKDRDGREWEHLCNDCFDELGCEYPEEEWD